jgi:hypothetical protein
VANAPSSTLSRDGRRARSRRLALVLAVVAAGFYAAFIYVSYLKSHP